MIRLTELKLPLDHAVDDLPALIAGTLGIAPSELASHTIYKRSYDARKQKLLLVYITDVVLTSAELETRLLAEFAGSPHVRPTPDQHYYPVAHIDTAPSVRPVVVGFGPCGIFAALAGRTSYLVCIDKAFYPLPASLMVHGAALRAACWL